MYPLSIIAKQFNINAKCSSNWTLSNMKTHMRDATEFISSIVYALFAVIKAISSNQNGFKMIMK